MSGVFGGGPQIVPVGRRTARVLTVANSAAPRVIATRAGPLGPKGADGAQGGAHTHDQPGALATWVVNHNLGYRPATAAYSVGGMLMWANIQHINDNQVQIHFDGPVSGYAVCS